MSNSNAPHKRPAIPDDIDEDEVLAIVTVHDARAPRANEKMHHATTRIIPEADESGINVFLRWLKDTPNFTIGREVSMERVSRGVREEHDIYLPDSSVGMRQCVLQPVPEQNLWRLHSTSKVIAVVNGAPIQDYAPTSKRQLNFLPKAVYLKQSAVNVITVKGIRFDIWLLKSAQVACQSVNFRPTVIPADIQGVTSRPEQWAHNRYDLTDEQVSAKTFRVVNRFTGDREIAKVFQADLHPQQTRDAEFLLMSRAEIDTSIVRYRQCIELETIPAIITDTHEGCHTYEALRAEIHKSHPGSRFELASKLVRRLLSALTWLHFNGIIHGNVSKDSVLLRIIDGKLEKVLLVNYSTAHPFVSGEMVPLDEMIADGHMAMQLIEDCCDIWALRNGPCSTATAGNVMRQRTLDLMNKHEAIKRVFDDYLRKGNFATDSKGTKLAKLQDKLKNSWKSAHDKETQNRAAREVASMSKSKIDAMVKEWEHAHPPQSTIYKQYMLLSLGHPYIDSLANHLYVNRWELTPHEICDRLRRLGGAHEQPWQTFEVRRLTPIGHIATTHYETPIMAWLATCCEVFPEWRQAIEELSQVHLRIIGGGIPQGNLLQLRDALLARDILPTPISAMFKLMASVGDVPEQVEESYQVWYHFPSRLFNITQLQRLATPERLATTITDGQTRCNDFVEVRGDPRLEGCYASLTFLEAFVEQLGLVLPQAPDLRVTRPTFDPSDFREIPQSRIVLARPGMLGYGSMLRTGDQANFLFSRTPTMFDTLSSFIPTNFGDMKVLPRLPQDVRTHVRPEHWSKYRTADEYEAQANVSSRRIKKAVSRKVREGAAFASESAPTIALPDVMEVDEFPLGQFLRERERVRAEARPPIKRDTDAMASKPEKSSPKRLKDNFPTSQSDSSKTLQLPSITQSFVERAEVRMQERPSRRPTPSHPSVPFHGPIRESGPSFLSGILSNRGSAVLDPGMSMTDVADDEGLEDDWALVEKMLEQVNEDDDPEVQGITGFQIHDFDASMTGAAGPGYIGKGKGKGKAVASATAPTPTSAQRPSATMHSLSSNQHTNSSLSQSFRFSPPQSPRPSTHSPRKGLGDSPAVSSMKKHQRKPSSHSSGDDMPDTRPTSPVVPSPHKTGAQQSTAAAPTASNAQVRPPQHPLPELAQPFSRLTQFFQASLQEPTDGSPTQINTPTPGGSGPSNSAEHARDTGNPLFGTPRRASRFFQDIGGNPGAGAGAGDEDMLDTDGEEEG